MQFLNLTLPEPEANLALDDALLDEAERLRTPTETLRLWEPTSPMAVLGTSSRVHDEVDEQGAARHQVPIFRRISGGLAIVTGPGCLMYSLVLSYRLRPQLRSLDEAHRYVLEKLAVGLGQVVAGVERCGTSDLAIAGKKFSGNSVRCKKDNILYHGTLLYDFPLHLISKCLKQPPRQPDYRGSRAHDEFVMNLNVPIEQLRRVVVSSFGAEEVREDWPQAETERLVKERYRLREWNYRS